MKAATSRSIAGGDDEMGCGEGEDEAGVVTSIEEEDGGVHGEVQLALAQLVEAARKATIA